MNGNNMNISTNVQMTLCRRKVHVYVKYNLIILTTFGHSGIHKTY